MGWDGLCNEVGLIFVDPIYGGYCNTVGGVPGQSRAMLSAAIGLGTR